MKNYDMNVHIPQQMENYLQAYAGADIPTLVRSLENIKDVVGNPEFQKDLYQYEKQKKKTIDDKLNNTVKKVKEAVEGKNVEDTLFTISSILEGLNTELDMVEQQYWEHIRGYLLNWFRNHEQ